MALSHTFATRSTPLRPHRNSREGSRHSLGVEAQGYSAMSDRLPESQLGPRPSARTASAFNLHDVPSGPSRRPGLPVGGFEAPSLPSLNTSSIYETIYDTRWRLMSQEEARLQRENTQRTTPTPPNSVPSSREGSVDPVSRPSSAQSFISQAPRSVVVMRTEQGFGLTLRHFIVYPPEESDGPKEPAKETIFVKNIIIEGPAFNAGIREGDAIVSVNGQPVVEQPYSQVIQNIKNTPKALYLTVLPQEEDIVQRYFSEIAQNPESNRPVLPPMPSVRPSPATSQRSLSSSCYGDPSLYGTSGEGVSSVHIYDLPAHRQNRFPMQKSFHRNDRDQKILTRMQKANEDKEKFLKRQPEDVNLPMRSENSMPASRGGSRKASDMLPPVPVANPTKDGRMYSQCEGTRITSPPDFLGRIREDDLEVLTDRRPSHHNGIHSRRSSTSLTPPTAFSAWENHEASQPDNPSHLGVNQVRRRSKAFRTPEDSEERNIRRISYLRATKDEEAAAIATSLSSVQSEETTCESDVGSKKKSFLERHATTSNRVQKAKAPFGDQHEEEVDSHEAASEAIQDEEIKQGCLQVKVVALDGKKATDRSWKNVYAIIRNNCMFMYKDKKVAEENPKFTEETPVPLIESQVEIADDYTKQRNVFRLKTIQGSEYLCKTEQEYDMREWINAIEESNVSVVVDGRKDSGSGTALSVGGTGGKAKGLKKLTSFRNRSPITSPSTKTRKAASQDPMPTRESPMSTSLIANTGRDKKTWKDKVTKQWKKMQPSTLSSMPQEMPEIGSIGVRLENCPMSEDEHYDCIPKLVATCCKIVEERGLEIVGVYRVPGNSAAINYLTEQLKSADLEEAFQMEDHRWSDVNVVSSLLKSFFRTLPEPLFTDELYPCFIEASKIDNATDRLNNLKQLTQSLPDVHRDTLKYLVGHLCQVNKFSETNKMDIKNLALIFGPTLVRPADYNMISMVTDMSQQCRTIESILSNADWFFDNEPMDVNEARFIMGLPEPQTVISQTGNETILLSNLQKLEYQGKVRGPSNKELASGIISAANRKKNRAALAKTSPSVTYPVQRMEVDACSVNPAVAQRLQTPPLSGPSSRRNSESVIQSAAKIAAAVPQLFNSASNSANSSATNIPIKITYQDDPLSDGSALRGHPLPSPYFKPMSASADNISRVSNLNGGAGPHTPQSRHMKYPLAESVSYRSDPRREMPKNPHYHHHSEVVTGLESPTLEAWKSESAEGGIVLQEPYQTKAYSPEHPDRDRTQRFVNMNYLSPNARGGIPLSKGFSTGNMLQSDPSEFELDRTFPLGRHQRMILQKCATESFLNVAQVKDTPLDSEGAQMVPSQADSLEGEPYGRPSSSRGTVSPKATESDQCDVMNSVSASFEKLHLLLDPYSSGSPTRQPASHRPQNRRLSGQNVIKLKVSKSAKPRCGSLGGPAPDLAAQDKRNAVRKSELKRGKLVDKSKEPPFRQQLVSQSNQNIALKRQDSLSKREKQSFNIRRRAEKENLRNRQGVLYPSDLLVVEKVSKTRKNQKRIRRRHTVGGTKDFGDWEKVLMRHRPGYPEGSSTIRHPSQRWSSAMDSAGSNEDEFTDNATEAEENVMDDEGSEENCRFPLPLDNPGPHGSTSDGSGPVRGRSLGDNSPQLPSLLESQV